MSYFIKQGRALLANGYLIIPIKPGEKRPALTSWQTARLGVPDLVTYSKCGVGVLCGQGAHPIVGFDVDSLDEALVNRFVEWCRRNLGATSERIGKAPKILLPYRAEVVGGRKAASAWFEDLTGERHRFEVLGHGQQFVAYHDHPDTGLPYDWVDLFGGIAYTRADELPIITEAQIQEAILVFEQMAIETGLVKASKGVEVRSAAQDDDDPFQGFSPRLGLSLSDVAKKIGYLDNGDYDTWLKVGMALHHEFEADDAALDVWDEWSSTAPNYTDRDDLEKRWLGFGSNGRTPTTARWLLKLGNQAEAVALRVEKREAFVALQTIIKNCDDSIGLLDTVAKQAREVIADTPELSAEVGAALKNRYRELTGVALPSGDLAKALREPTAPTVQAKRPLTEFGNAERLLDKYGAGLMYVPELAAWFCWTGIYWRKAPDVEIEHYAKETVKALAQELPDQELAEFFKFCASSQQAKMVHNMVTLAKSDPRVMVPACELDKYDYYLGALNGVIDLKTGELLPPDPELRITKVTGCNYVPGAKAPLFRQTVAEVFTEQDMTDFFQRVVGYAAMGQPTEDIMVIPHGNGSNGKSTVLGSIRRVFGGYAKSAEASTFVSDAKGASNAGGAREDLLRLKGARFVYVNEPDENSELREGSVKSMTGGDALSARGLYSKDSVEIVPSWVVFMPTNHKPIVKGSDNGIWRRLMLIPFNRNFDDDQTIVKDTYREAKLMAELEGILSWVVEGALSYQKMGLAQIGAVKEAREQYRSQMDLLSEWLEECCEVSEEFFEESNHLWQSWEQYAKQRGLLLYVKNSVSLGRRLDARFPAFKQSGGKRMRKGLRLRAGLEDLF